MCVCACACACAPMCVYLCVCMHIYTHAKYIYLCICMHFCRSNQAQQIQKLTSVRVHLSTGGMHDELQNSAGLTQTVGELTHVDSLIH